MRLLRLTPDALDVERVASVLDAHLTAGSLQAEAASLDQVCGADDVVEHWLAAYAVLALTERPAPPG